MLCDGEADEGEAMSDERCPESTNTPPELGLLVQREPSKHTMRHDLRAWQLDAVRDLTNLVEKRLRGPRQVPVDDGMREWGERAAKVLRGLGWSEDRIDKELG